MNVRLPPLGRALDGMSHLHLSPAQRADRLVSGDAHMAAGRHTEGEHDHLEASIGALVVRGPGDHGYNPMIARMMASLGRVAS